MARDEKQKAYLEKLTGGGQAGKAIKAIVYKCWDCEIELLVPPHLEYKVKSGQTRCNNPRCPGRRKGGGRYVKK